MTPLNLTGQTFCKTLGITYTSDFMRELRYNNLVNHFKIGTKYMYHYESLVSVNQKLRSREIEIRTDNGKYYVTKK